MGEQKSPWHGFDKSITTRLSTLRWNILKALEVVFVVVVVWFVENTH